MKQKVFLSVLLILTVMGVTVSAKNYEVKTEDKVNYIIAAEFKDDLIYNIQIIKSETDSFEFSSDAEKITVYSVNDEGLKQEKAAEKTEETEVTDIEEESRFPEVYEIEKDANRAVMVVTSVASVIENEENVCEVKVLFHGRELTYFLPEDISLNAVPEYYDNLAGENVYSLKKGDIIKLNVTFSGKLKSVDLIFRPTSQNPVFSDNDFGDGFLSLFSKNGIVAGEEAYMVATPENGGIKSGYSYAFGIIKDYNDFELQLCDASGKALTIDVANKAICYIASKEDKFLPEKASLASIRQSTASKSAFDEDDNFLGWKEDESYNYAFVRLISNEATEVVLYKNY